ncbi:MAG: SgcJ/EcaC family oxidoreductase [Thermoleophilaceae bacterium]
MAGGEGAIRALYRQIVDGWNSHNGDAFAAPFADDGEMIGFDGSRVSGRDRIAAELGRIFADHETAPYIVKVRGVRALGADAAVLEAAAGMIPAGSSDIEPSRNAWQTLVAERRGGDWQVVLFQTTPAQYHGRPDEVERMTAELAEVAKR